MMAIVENNINDNYIYFREKNLSDIVKGKNNLIEEEIAIKQNEPQVENIKIDSKKGISKFLDEDDF